MTAYELMIKTNHHYLNGGVLNDAQKKNAVNQLLSARSTPEQAKSFYRGVRYPGNVDSSGGGRMYPLFFIPPYNGGKKYQTVIPMSPKTHILSSNSYELEILRILFLFAPDNVDVHNMIVETLARLKTTCFGYQSCYTGECFHTALIVLRFLAAVAPDETEWMQKQIQLYNTHANDSKRHTGVKKYFELCLSELPQSMNEGNDKIPERIKYAEVEISGVRN